MAALDEVVGSIEESLEDPLFYQAVHQKIAETEESSLTDPLAKLILSEFVEHCHDFDRTKIQESWSWRNVSLARELAIFLIDDKGALRKAQLIDAIHLLEANLYSLGPDRHHDAIRQRHLLAILRFFHEDPAFSSALKRISRPDGHLIAEKLIRETLFLPEKERVTDAHARRAALSALLTYLRQNVGSCFATAPAILIQSEQPLQLLSDLGQLLGLGRITRVIEGDEYAVPLSASWGVGDLYRPLFLHSLGNHPWKTLAASPGIKAALKAAGVQGEGESLLRATGLSEEPFSLLNPDLVVRSVLLTYFEVSEEDVEAYKARPREGIFGEFAAAHPQGLSGKAEGAHNFIRGYERAKETFKAITENALLKAWEFTLASLSETKADFARWNLSSSLGLHPEEPDGIGHLLYEKIQEKVERINEEIEEQSSRYDQLFAQAKYLEGRVRRASTESELSWLRADYQLRKLELNRLLSERDDAYERGRKLANLFPFLIEFYAAKFKAYFQEVYDAEMRDISPNPYDDTPAGFRLLYKHGRTSTALWTMIHSPEEYIQSLTSFFIATEAELSRAHEVETVQAEFTDLITAIITHVKRPEFLENSFHRLARAFKEPLVKDPLDHLDKIQRKPWAYTSGGTMRTLVSCYYGRAQAPKESSRWVENETELLAFLLDTIRELPLSVQNQFREDRDKSLLTFSPTHAFLVKPGWRKLQKGWDNDLYTYTWIRDHWVRPGQAFLASQILDVRMMEFLADKIAHFIPEGYRPIYKKALGAFSLSLRPNELRDHILKILSYERWMRQGHQLKILSEEIDSLLYSALPLFPEHQLRQKLETLFEGVEEIEPPLKEKLLACYDRLEESVGKYKILTAQDLRHIAKILLILVTGKVRSPIPYHQKFTEAMQRTGLCYPAPILFADTNWAKNYFGFIVSPGSEALELWRFDDCGSEGRPITLWKRYLDGTVRSSWGLYISPDEYQ